MPPRKSRIIYSSDIENSSDEDERQATPDRSFFGLFAGPSPPHSPGSPHTPPKRSRAYSLPPLSSDGLVHTSPIAGTIAQSRAATIRKSQRKRQATIMDQNEQARIDAEAAAERKQNASAAKVSFLNWLLDSLQPNRATWGDLMSHVFDPSRGQGAHRWGGFFNQPGSASQILDHWVSPQNAGPAQDEVHNWAVAYVIRVVGKEARTVNESGILQSKKQYLHAANVLNFSMKSLQDGLRGKAEVSMSLFEAFATSPRHKRKDGISPARWAKKAMVHSSNVIFKHYN